MAAQRDQAHSEANRMAFFLGLPHWRKFDDLAIVASVKKGFPARTAETVVRRIDPDGRFLHATDIIPKSTYHRRLKANKALTKDESERILALSKVFAEVLRLYHGETTLAAHFLLRPHPLLGARPPIELAKESSAGADLVLKLLVKAEAGVAV
jgi:putative toxin-antitoxin system antitoxin component (TIGR02293 family)